VDTEPDPEEAARRLRAAIAYVGISQEEAAKVLGVSIPTLARMLGRKGVDRMRPASWGELWRFADAYKLPRAWFVADVRRLYQIVPDELPSFPNDTGDFRAVSPAQRNAALAREAQALRREAQRSSARQPASRNAKRARKRRLDEDG
jgi:transcriptional regulator with XRE-family HTH domain